jgi:type I restriction enzyme S subunit
MKNWIRKKIADISIVFEDGDWIESKDQSADGIRLIQTGNVGNGIFKDRGEKARYISEATFKRLRCTEIFEGDCLVSRLPDPVGRACILPNTCEKMITAVDCTIIRFDNKQIIPNWFLYYSLSNEYQNEIQKQVTGATRQRISRKNLGLVSVPVAPLPEQQRIVSILDRCFTAIDKAKANAEQNLKNAKELFESYLQGVFEKKGEGWEEKRIDEICKLVNGRAYKKDELLTGGKYRVLRVGNFFTSDHWYYSDLELDEDKYCDKEDLLYAWSASFGPRIWKEEKVIYHYHIWKVIPDKNIVSRDFLFTLFEWDKEKIKAAQGTGTTMIHVSKGSMENRIVPVPPLIEQQTIIRQLDALRVETQKLESFYQQKIADLEELKKSILQKAFSGELSDTELYESKVQRAIVS